MSICIFHTEIWSFIPCKTFTCLTTARSKDTCFFATAITRRSITALPRSELVNISASFLSGRWTDVESRYCIFLIQSLLISEQLLKHKFSHISENFKAGNTLLAWTSGCLTPESSAFLQSGRQYLFCLDFLDAFSVSCSDIFLVSLPHEQYSATCMFTPPVIKPSTYTTHS